MLRTEIIGELRPSEIKCPGLCMTTTVWRLESEFCALGDKTQAFHDLCVIGKKSAQLSRFI